MAGWFYNQYSGSVNRVPTIGEAPYLIPGTGWHELLVPYSATRAQALAEAKKEFPNGSTPGGSLIGNVGSGVAGAALGTPVQPIGDFFHRLTEKETWVRVGEVALGGILLYVGVRALASGSPAVGAGARASAARPVKKVTRTVTKVAAPEVRLASRVAAKKVAPKVVAHRQRVARYGGKKPYQPPAPRTPPPPRVTTRVSHIYHHKGPVKK